MANPGLAPLVSVIIPVKDDIAGLVKCLDLLDRQTVAEPFEILVIDNGSDVPVRDELRDRPSVTVIYEPKPSSYAARNRGLEDARGGVLAFTDADCLPAPDWLETGLRALAAHPSATSFVGGNVLIDPGTPPLSAAAVYDVVRAFPQEHYIRQQNYAVTANLLVTRDAFERVGAFSETLISSGDREWGQRAGSVGVKAAFHPEVVVYHPPRATTGQLRRKARRIERGLEQLRRQRGEHLTTPALVRGLIPPTRSLIGPLGKVPSPKVGNTVKYLAVGLTLHYVQWWERLRIYLRG